MVPCTLTLRNKGPHSHYILSKLFLYIKKHVTQASVNPLNPTQQGTMWSLHSFETIFIYEETCDTCKCKPSKPYSIQEHPYEWYDAIHTQQYCNDTACSYSTIVRHELGLGFALACVTCFFIYKNSFERM